VCHEIPCFGLLWECVDLSIDRLYSRFLHVVLIGRLLSFGRLFGVLFTGDHLQFVSCCLVWLFPATGCCFVGWTLVQLCCSLLPSCLPRCRAAKTGCAFVVSKLVHITLAFAFYSLTTVCNKPNLGKISHNVDVLNLS